MWSSKATGARWTRYIEPTELCVECGAENVRSLMVCDVDANPDTAYYWCKPCADFRCAAAHDDIVSGAWDQRDLEDERAMG